MASISRRSSLSRSWKSSSSSWLMGSPVPRGSLSSSGRGPGLVGDARGHQQVDGARLGRLDDGHQADRAAERIGPLVVGGAHPDAHVRGGQLDVSALCATGPNCRHRRPLLRLCVRNRQHLGRVLRGTSVGRMAHFGRWLRMDGCPPGSPRCDDPPSPSPTAGPGPMLPRTRSRPSCWPCSWVPRASRATPGSPPTAGPCSTTTAWSVAGCAAARSTRSPGPTCPPTSPSSTSSTPPAAPDFELSLDVKDAAVAERRGGQRRGGRTGRGRAPVAVPRRPRHAHRAGGSAGRRCAWSTRRRTGRLRGGLRAPRRHPGRPRHRRGQPPPDASGPAGGIALYHRFERLAFAWDVQFERLMDELFDAGIDALYSDHVDRLMDRDGPLG